MEDQVLIVDDEPIIRKGLKSFIEWEKEGLSLQGDCANGFEALEIIKSQHIDILITDIKMPVMDGLQLTREALEVNPNMKIVLISSYNEFEYVREGMKSGAIDYLLKPSLEADELVSVLRRCKQGLRHHREQLDVIEKYNNHALVLRRKKYEQDIIKLLVTNHSDSRLVDIFGEYNGTYMCAFVILDGLHDWQERYGKLHISVIYEDIQAIFYDSFDKGTAPLLAGEGIYLLYPDAESAEDAEVMLYQFKKLVEDALGMQITISYCMEQATQLLEESINKSRSAGLLRFFEGTGKIYKWLELSKIRENETEHIEMNMHTLLEIIRKSEQSTSVIETLEARWRSKELSSEQVKKEAVEFITAFAYSNGVSRSYSDFRENVWRCETLEQVESTVRGLMKEMEHPSLLRLNDKGHSGQLVTKAIEYIKLHYLEELTLQDVADSIHVSKNYCSNLFKKQAGQNFIDYLIDLRMHEAKRLLVLGECKIYEVAEKSGFNDVKYFSKLFKKITQMTPLEYRENHQSG
ncbi:response regulator [Cohnella sp.]|uniref:response regulator transcription factor n=1 Tax=Cohnella sp. TaxID=1883426 RepID=UPI00356694CD